MANLKEVRLRIVSVSSTQQITKAMKMVSAAKLRRAQDAILQLRPYAQKLREILENLSESMGSEADYSKVRALNKVLIVCVTSNRGLCGAFNSNVIRTTNKLISEKYAEQNKAGNVKVLCIGKKASDYFSKNKSVYLGNHNEFFANLKFDSVAKLADEIMNDFKAEKYDRVEIVYNQFKNAASQVLISEQFLPIEPPKPKDGEKKKQTNDYIFEPNQHEIVVDLIPKSLRTQLFKSVLDSHASEHGARMTAMNKATDNAQELIKQLKLSYNKARQAAITAEILEIVGGAEALNG